VGELDEQGHVVGDEQDREAEPFAQFNELGEDLPLHDDVQGGGRLVHDDDLWLQGGAEQRDRQAGGHEPSPGALGEGLLALGPEQNRPPVPFGHSGDADEGEGDLGHHREDDGADEVRGDDRGQVRQDLEADDAPGALAGRPGRLHVVAAAKRQGLGAQHPRPPGPGGEADDQGDDQVAADGDGRGDDDDQRQGGDDQEDVGQGGEPVVGDAAEVAGGHSDQDGERGGDDAGHEPDQDHAAGADQHLAEHVLAEVGGAEPVRGRGGLHQVGAAQRRVVRRDPRADHREQDEERQHAQAGGGLGV